MLDPLQFFNQWKSLWDKPVELIELLIYSLELDIFVEEGIKEREELISQEFDIIENAHKIITHIKSFKEYLTTYTNHDEEFHLNIVSTFVMKDLSHTEESIKK